MRTRHEIQKAERIEAAVALIHDRLPESKAGIAERFLRQFYDNVAPGDLVHDEVEDLFGAAITMWAFGRERQPGVPKVRAYNPRFEEVGWQSPHTVIEIVNDDMPFLVDSVTAALSKQDLTVHLVIHPILRVVRDAKGVAASLAGSGGIGEGGGF
jgi:glutamate dehydrogenase